VPLFAHTGASFFRTPAWTRLDPSAAVEASVLAERLGYDSLWVADHLLHGHDGGILEGWSTLAYLAGATSRIKLGTIHLAHLLRPPALTAKMAATLDALSNGRLIFFYDVGGGEPESTAYGYDVPPLAERIDRMDEGLQLIRQLWTSEEPIDFAGRFYRTKAAVCRPKPLQRPTPPIWLGEIRDDSWGDVVWRHASGWNSTPVSVAEYRSRLDRLASAPNRGGRDLSDLELSLEIEVMIGPNRAAVRQLADEIAALPAPGSRFTRDDLVSFLRTTDPQQTRLPASYEERTLVGTPDDVVDRIREYQQLGIRHFMLWFLDFPSRRGMELVAEKVLPAIR
jgi:alkanesulfonate monooxygenase SsuD/methylene tetrahydromethanopterin reductase-like flavin-dependent oxidoreductase (luciferase family)